MRRSSFYLVLLLFVCVVMVLLFNSSSCYAYSWNDFLDYCELIKQNSTNNNNKTAANWVLNNKNAIQNYVNNIPNLDEYSTWYLYRRAASLSNNGNIGIIAQQKGTAWNWGASVKSTPATGWVIKSAGNAINWGVGTWYSSTLANGNMASFGDGAVYIGLIDGEQVQNLNINFGSYEWNNFYQQWGTNYLEFNNSFVNNTTYNGNLFTYYYKGDFYSNLNLKIGSIIPNDSYYYEVRFLDNATNVILGSSFVSLNVDPILISNGDDCLYIDDDQNVYVVTRYLKYNKQYRIDIISYYGDGGDDNLAEDDDFIIFLPYNASISGDTILSFGSGDFTQQDSANQIIDTTEQQTQDIIGYISDYSGASGEMSGFFSGNVLSGDIIGGIEMPRIRT